MMRLKRKFSLRKTQIISFLQNAMNKKRLTIPTGSQSTWTKNQMTKFQLITKFQKGSFQDWQPESFSTQATTIYFHLEALWHKHQLFAYFFETE